jgi:peptidoglycan/xylan/chitin deacetylase (PgdA/CDA1 family)
MLIRSLVIPFVLAFSLFGSKPTPVAKSAASSKPSATPAVAAVAPAPTITKPVIDQTAETVIFGYHRFVNKVRHPDTEITPAAFEEQMKDLKDHGITVIRMQDLLAWKRGEKNIPPHCAVITFDDGWQSQYDVAWPILKKFGYPLTMFIYTEGVRGGHFGGGEAITWEELGEMRDAGVDIEAHSQTHQDLRKPYDKVTKHHLNPAEYEQWLHNEIAGSKDILEQKLAIKVDCFAVPYGFYNEHIKQVAQNAGYSAIFTVYGQPITYHTSPDSMGRYMIEGNKPKVFADAVKLIGASTSGGTAVAEVGPKNLSTQPANGETIRTSLPLIKANLSGIGQVDPKSVQMRISGVGLVPASYDAKTGVVAYQVTQKLRDKSCAVILSAKAGGKKVETHWTFGIEEAGAPSSAPAPKK